MRIIVGSRNPVKVDAVREALAEYEAYADSDIDGIETQSGVADQPKSIDETVTGALNRARAAFVTGADLGFGIESGLMQVPGSKSGYMDVCVCAIYDGAEHHLGLSSAFECPREVTDMMVKGGLDMSQAMNASGYVNDPDIGSKEGAIGIFTKGRVTRKDYTMQAVRMAMIHLDRAHPHAAQ